MLGQELASAHFAILGEDDRFRLANGVQSPAPVKQEIHQVPVQPLPNSTAIVKRKGEKRECCFSELLAVQSFGKLYGSLVVVPHAPASLAV